MKIYDEQNLKDFSFKNAIIFLVNGYTADGRQDIENALDLLQEVVDDYLAEIEKQKKEL